MYMYIKRIYDAKLHNTEIFVYFMAAFCLQIGDIKNY